MSPRRVLAVVAVGALTLALAACDPGSDEPTAAPSPSTTTAAPEPTTSAPPTDEPTSAAPEVPPPNPADFPGMDQQTEEGAKQAFRYFWAALLYGYATGDSGPFDGVSSTDCKYCASARGDIEALRDREEYWDLVTPIDGESQSVLDADSSALVIYEFRVPEHAEPGETTGIRTHEAEVPHKSAGKLQWTEGRWEVRIVDLDQ